MHLRGSLVSCATLAAYVGSASATCESLVSDLNIVDVAATVQSAVFYPAFSNVTVGGGQGIACQNFTRPEVDICRVTINIATSNRSTTYMEVWLPSNGADSSTGIPWNGRFLSTGGGGLGGCVDYDRMTVATSMGFASTGDNGGHNGNPGNGTPFLNNPDVVVDFAYRARHAAVVAGKQVVAQYYGTPHSKSYYYGCSTGGRQGLKAAQMFPADFDGIIAGAPASDFNHLASWSGHFITLTGLNASDARWLNLAQWTAVHGAVLRQCDGLDGAVDGILEDSSICNFNPEAILCSRINGTVGVNASCLSTTQAQTVRAVFSPVYGLNNSYIYPRLSPGAELTAFRSTGFGALAGGLVGPGPAWYRNAIYNDVRWDPTTFNAYDIAYADSLDAAHGFVSSYSGDLSGFRDAGGKMISYHGYADAVIPGEQAIRYYNHVADTMNASATDIDDFYRLFMIGGMGHCSGGDGAWAFGQAGNSRNASTSILQELVNWVENDDAPDRLIGTKFVNDSSVLGVQFQRAHCRYPYRTTFVGGNSSALGSWDCELIEDWDVCSGRADELPKLC